MYSMKKVYVLYENGNHKYFQMHNVAHDEKRRPVILQGKPLTKQALRCLSGSLKPEQNLSYFNSNVLASAGLKDGPAIWWIPPSQRPMFFKEGIGISTSNAPWPGLVLVTRNRSLNIYAVAGKERPSLDTRLYVAPLLNMSGSSICMGNACLPDDCDAYEEWENALQKSAFSEDRDGRCKSKSIARLWKKIIKSGRKSFPEKELLPLAQPETLGDLINGIKGGKQW